MNNRTKILYIKQKNSSFIVNDQAILEKEYDVKSFLALENKNIFKYSKTLFKLFCFLVLNSKNTKFYITWFVGYHTVMMVIVGKLLRKKTIIFAGGSESICYPELGKGVYQNKFRAKLAKYALKNADLIIPNHKSLIYHENSFYRPDNPKKDGIKHYIPKIKTKMEIVYNGFDVSVFNRDNSITKDSNTVITVVGGLILKADFFNKGNDLFIEVARRNKHINFIHIGFKKEFIPWLEDNYKISEIPNLKIVLNPITLDELVCYYNKAKVFYMISITEGMPNVISEAMLCECVVVGSNVNGIPDAIGGNGVIVYNRDINEVEAAIQTALKLDTGISGREYTINNFTIEQRENKILNLLKSNII
ncbi:MAG: glycosyltransferase family 4 protein [Bacteroidota bacterium]